MIAILLLWPLYLIGIQYERKGVFYLLFPITLIAAIIDIVLNYTELALLTWDWPKSGEYTFSTRLERLIHSDGWRGTFANFVKKYMLDWADPDGVHIK